MKHFLSLITILFTLLNNYTIANDLDLLSTKNRGLISEYDQGAPIDSEWTNLFANTPNYLAFGNEIISGKGEKFRWHMGPMFYRGRLTPNDVKIFIIGQEGAQDENISNRSFTGSTGTRMQKFLNYFGVTKSYLFMNTFVYTIKGQYSLYGDDATNDYKVKQWKELMWLAQNEDSIIVKHRHDMFNYMLKTNKKSLRIVIGVGTAGKESLVTWFNSIAPGSCHYDRLTRDHCVGKNELEGIIGIGVRHPGASSARNAGSSATSGISQDFKKKASFIANKIAQDKNWLEKDKDGIQNFNSEFKYGYASIPHRDFAFGTPWTFGAEGTSSNRRGSDTIQIFSDEGCYNNGARVNGRCLTVPPDERPLEDGPDPRLDYLFYKTPKNTLNKNQRPLGFMDGDLPFEPPKNIVLRNEFDLGPQKIAQDLMKFYLKIIAEDDEKEIVQHSSFGPTGMYRGNTTNPSLLIFADQQGHTDLFSGRALTGEKGQQLQTFLNGAGLQGKYLIIRSLPVDCLDQNDQLACEKLRKNPKVISATKELILNLIKTYNFQSLISYGEYSKEIINFIRPNIGIFHLDPHTKNPQEEFTSLFEEIKNQHKLSGHFFYNKYVEIPRSDLPYMTRWWMGTSGDRAERAINMENLEVSNGRITGYDLTTPNGNYYKLYAPNWATNWETNKDDLNSDELKSIQKFKEYQHSENQ